MLRVRRGRALERQELERGLAGGRLADAAATQSALARAVGAATVASRCVLWVGWRLQPARRFEHLAL